MEHGRIVDKKCSIVQRDDYFFGRAVSRTSSVGCSSRLFYYRTAEGIPFKWEMQPGTPKDPPKEELLPPLSPPPAVLSLGFPKPCIEIEEPKPSMRSKLRKYIKKIHGRKKKQERKHKGSDHVNCETNGRSNDDSFEIYDCFNSSDGDFATETPPRNSISSSSSTLSLGRGHYSRQFSRLDSASRDSMNVSYGRSLWNLSSIIVCVPRRPSNST